jgi:hypothetical protein
LVWKISVNSCCKEVSVKEITLGEQVLIKEAGDNQWALPEINTERKKGRMLYQGKKKISGARDPRRGKEVKVEEAGTVHWP